MLIIVLTDIQEPVIVRGFANTLCARESFKKVMQQPKSFQPNSFVNEKKNIIFSSIFYRRLGQVFAIF